MWMNMNRKKQFEVLNMRAENFYHQTLATQVITVNLFWLCYRWLVCVPPAFLPSWWNKALPRSPDGWHGWWVVGKHHTSCYTVAQAFHCNDQCVTTYSKNCLRSLPVPVIFPGYCCSVYFDFYNWLALVWGIYAISKLQNSMYSKTRL